MAEETVADDDMVMIRGSSNTRACTVLLRGANDYMLDEMDRSLHDAFCVVKRVLESGNVVPGLSTCFSTPYRSYTQFVLALVTCAKCQLQQEEAFAESDGKQVCMRA